MDLVRKMDRISTMISDTRLDEAVKLRQPIPERIKAITKARERLLLATNLNLAAMEEILARSSAD